MALLVPEWQKQTMTTNYEDYALKRFRRKGINPTDENDLIRVIEDAIHLYDVHDAVILLRRFGSTRAIPALKRAMYYAMQDVKIASLCTLAGIAKEAEADFYTSALLDTKYRTKWAAMYAIFEYGNASAIAPVIKRLKAILSRPRGRTWGNNTEVVLAVKFLTKFAEADCLSSDALSLWKVNGQFCCRPSKQNW